MEMLGFLAAVLGVVAAIINRKRIIVVRHEHSWKTPDDIQAVSIKGRLGQFLIYVSAAFVLPVLYGIIAVNTTQTIVEDVFFRILIVTLLICLMMAGYQFVALIIQVIAKL